MTNRPKVDLPTNGEPLKLKLLKAKPFEGKSNTGDYFLYTVEQNSDGVERAFFAPDDIHQKIQEFKLKTGDTFSLVKADNGKKNSFLIVLNGKSSVSEHLSDDQFKEIMKQCLQDAIAITKEVNTIPWQNDDIRSICSCLFIARTR